MKGKVSIAGARKSAGLTQEELAGKIGITKSYMCRIETGKKEIKPYMLYAICYVCGFSVDDIFLPKELA